MKPLKVLFFSSSPISVPLLKALLNDERFLVQGLFCQPDKPAGRGQVLTAPETKIIAEAAGIQVYQAPKLSLEVELLQELKKAPPDFLVTFAYGQILSEAWLELPLLAPVNVHASLLPLYRGASPIQGALLDGQAQTGLSVMKMEKGMDTGPVAVQHVLDIDEDETAEELFDELADLAAESIPEDLIRLSQGLAFLPQDSSKATFTSKISKEEGRVDFSKDAETLFNRFRAYTPWPGLWTTHDGIRVKLLDVERAQESDLKPGQLVYKDFAFYLGTARGVLKINRLQLEGKKSLDAQAFILGLPEWNSTFLGT